MSVELHSEIIMDLLLSAWGEEKCQMKTDFSVNLYFSFSFNSRIPFLLFVGGCSRRRGNYIKKVFVPRNNIPESLILLNG